MFFLPSTPQRLSPNLPRASRKKNFIIPEYALKNTQNGDILKDNHYYCIIVMYFFRQTINNPYKSIRSRAAFLFCCILFVAFLWSIATIFSCSRSAGSCTTNIQSQLPGSLQNCQDKNAMATLRGNPSQLLRTTLRSSRTGQQAASNRLRSALHHSSYVLLPEQNFQPVSQPENRKKFTFLTYLKVSLPERAGPCFC